MPKLKSEAKKILTPKAKREANGIFINLTAGDRKNATIAAVACHQTLAEWISSMVNTSLQP
jgi:hypothetical protein